MKTKSAILVLFCLPILAGCATSDSFEEPARSIETIPPLPVNPPSADKKAKRIRELMRNIRGETP